MKTALVTGVTGQDGSYLAEFLLKKNYRVLGMIRRTSTINFERIEHIQDKIDIVQGDLMDQLSLIEILKHNKVDEVYNLAAQSFVPTSWNQPVLTGEVTGLGVTRMLEAIRLVNPKIKFYQASSSEMFGKVEESPQNEKTRFHPRSPYGVSKVYGYWITVNYRESYNIFACNGILFNHECVSENTPIIIRDNETRIISIKRAKDIRRAREKGRNVQQWDINNIEIWDGERFVPLKFITATRRKSKNKEFKCKIINSRHGVVNVTNHHNMLNHNNEKIKAQDVKNGSKLLHMSFPESNKFCTLSEEEAAFLGMMVGDGYIGEKGNANFSNNNKKIMEEFKNIWKKVGLGSISIEKFKTEYGSTIRAKLKGNPDYLRLIRNEIYTYDGYKKVPDRILNSNKEIQMAFLRAYNCTDGLKSNPCTYLFRNFKTNSVILAQGLLFLIHNTSAQDFNITFEKDEKYYGYYSINLLSPIDNSVKEKIVKKLIKKGLSQREISRHTGISRNFISKIQQGGHAETSHHLAKPKNQVKKTIYHGDQPVWVYDLETSSGKFMAGLGTIVISNSPRRGIEFVTRKITDAVARIKHGISQELGLGNLDAKRDWGFALDYVEAMYLMLQQDKPDDYVIATGETHSVREFCEVAFRRAGMDIIWKGKGKKEHGINAGTGKTVIKVDEKYFRPAEVHLLLGDCSKAREILKWEPKVRFSELVEMMVDQDLKRYDEMISQGIMPRK